MNHIHIRNMVASDVDDIVTLSGELGYITTPTLVQQRMCQLLARDDTFAAVAIDRENRPIGFVHATAYHLFTSPVFSEIMALVVSERHRRQGIGQALVTAAETWAQSQGHTHLRLRSGIHRAEEAHVFYKQIGYDASRTSVLFRKEF
ncbi:GNAT superfamily N-acetyltransferase [Chitinivorax tropicus]|uniref:GNAT superfamily N-acetyltransferase n=1 Tax=Chitinivorax tropicus TaxID=714531 RepID=A0A840MV05_9PROT|nr:GNAT family N-acetyltransferase [Chitinivorax tropicus]MBB5020186.1 GNAT superfamily N-acetyltransferase [Chitinivorax tropicus]